MIVRGDCVALMAELAEGSVDAIVTDPPYALPGGFMGKTWDRFTGREDVAFGYWLAGFIDGEGCFRVQRHERGTHSCTFSLQIRRDDRAVLDQACRALGMGTVIDSESSGSSPMVRWAVQDRAGCEALVGFLRRFPLRAKKRLDFDVWADAVGEWIGRPRGNRWVGSADQTEAAALKARIERNRVYTDPAWSGHPFQDWCREWGAEAYRVLKPGGHVLAFGGTRSYHRLTAGLEDAGFEIRDCLAWLYGSGFPKSHNLEGESQGWGTALKPAHEPIVLARKPLSGTVAATVLEHGTGALNVDGCRIGDDLITAHGGGINGEGRKYGGGQGIPALEAGANPHSGRWPANVVLDERAAEMLDQQTGELYAPVSNGSRGDGMHGTSTFAIHDRPQIPTRNDSGGASRFLYVAKASSAERNAGLDGFEEQSGGIKNQSGRGFSARGEPYKDIRVRNIHPTVKPIELMRWLVRLVTPPGGTVLDPFTGSGTTGCAAALEGFNFLGFEREAEYVKIAEARIAWWSQHPDGLEIVKALEAERERKAIRDSGQLDLLA